MRLDTVVVGVDFDSQSNVALVQAISLARSHEARVVLVHGSGVTDAGAYVHEEAMRAHEPWKDYARQRMERAESLLEEAAETVRREGLEVVTRLCNGFADAAIINTAREEQAGMVLVGSHGREGRDRWLLGSVAERVARLSERPVWVARGSARPSDGALRKVLVATDFSETAERGLAVALGLVSAQASVDLVHCWMPPHQYGVVMPEPMRHRMVERVAEQGNQLLAQHSRRAIDLHFRLIEAPAVAGILKQLESDDYDLVIIGSHGRRGVRRMILGSVAEKVLRHANQSVLVVHGYPHDP